MPKNAQQGTPVDLGVLEALLAKATPGPWFYRESKLGGCGVTGKEERVYAVEICGDARAADCSPWTEGCGKRRWSSRVIAKIQDWCQWTDHPANRDLILSLRNQAPALFDELRAAREQITLLTAERDEARAKLDHLTIPRPESEWHEDYGTVLWHHMPIQEPPYVGSGPGMGETTADGEPTTCRRLIDEGWLTHWTPLPDDNEIMRKYDAAMAAQGLESD